MLDATNINTLWASVLVETLAKLGCTLAVVSPGSRSTPLTVAFARHPQITAIPILDERSAAFFALGHAKASHRATVLVCTSGTAAANYFPAIIEAYESQIPLLVLTADRPAELRDCASGQTIDQQKLFGRYVQHYQELALPEVDLIQLRYLRQQIVYLWQRSHSPSPGPVHLNCPFRDPLAPTVDRTHSAVIALRDRLNDTFFDHIHEALHLASPPPMTASLPPDFGQSDRGLIIVGPAQPADPVAYCDAIASLAKRLGWVVLADSLSPLRHHASRNPALIATYDLLLRHPDQAQTLAPEQVLQIGSLPTSKVLREWLAQVDPQRWILTPSGRNLDPLHGRTIPLPLSLCALLQQLAPGVQLPTAYAQAWLTRSAIATQKLHTAMQAIPDLFEGKLSWLLPTLLPPKTPLFIANSMPVRDVEWFLPLNDQGIQPYCSRGANGIDGTLSTALGIAHYHHQAVLLTGDLAFLHDSNGLLNVTQRHQNLTILLINNEGGGIFEMLPISQFEAVFDSYFTTPQAIDLAALAAAHGITHQLITTWESLTLALAKDWTGIRLLELRCDRKRDWQHRRRLWQIAVPGTLGT
jgi:2-succinyl-5-enolpyruvyl-6-hydroxy-3-cyclohexene-1-carboxylate synthase